MTEAEIPLEPYKITTAGHGQGAEDESYLNLLSAGNDDDDDDDSEIMTDRIISKAQVWDLYTTHILSTWTARTYEFAAILFTASAYPDTLLASSLRGIFNTTASICFSSLLGVWVDRAPSRLRTLLTTIFANRCAVLLACICWVFLVDDRGVGVGEQRLTTTNNSSSTNSLAATPPLVRTVLKNSLFALAVFLGTLEKLSGVANMICVERDWIPILAPPVSDETSSVHDLTHLNAAMRRIDLICKLIAPVLISVVISATKSTRVGVYAVAGMSVVSWPADYICARRVYDRSPRLRQHKRRLSFVDEGETRDSTILTTTPSPNPPTASQPTRHLLHATTQALTHYTRSLRAYFSTPVWQPSLALAILHLSVLSYSATFLTYLLDTGFSLLLITVVRALSSVVEVATTFVTPWGVRYLSRSRRLGRSSSRPDIDIDIDAGGASAGVELETQTQTLLPDERSGHPQTTTTTTTGAANGVGLERLGLWGISWQFATTIPVVFALWKLSPSPGPSSTYTPPASSPAPSHFPLILRTTTNTPLLPLPLLTTTIFLFLSLTRLGLWTFDLTTQELTQTRVPASQRSSFAGTEMSFVATCELGHWVLAAVLSRPEQFRYLAGMSLGAVGAAAGLYAGWVRGRRGHLLHLGLARCKCGKGRGWER